MARYIVQHRRGSAEQWADKNTIIPKAGEIVIEIDDVNSLHKLKIGDGVHTYGELAYLQAGDEIVTQVLTKALPRVITITLDVDKWEKNPNSATCYKQTIELDGVTLYSRLDLQPDTTMLEEFKGLGIGFVAENTKGVIAVKSVGNKPLKTYVMQASLVETDVSAELDTIIGIPVGAPGTSSSPGGSIDSLDANKIIFPNGLNTTYPFGKIRPENGAVEQLIPPGGTLAQVFANLVDEMNPTITDLSVALTFSEAKAYEFGTYVTPTFTATFDPGSYSYGPDTGVTVKSWSISDNASHKSDKASGSFPEFQVTNIMKNATSGYKITAKANHTGGAMPITNLGNNYADGQIQEGEVSVTSGAVTGYRNSFYGTFTTKETLDSSKVRTLGKSGKALSNGSTFTVNVPVDALRVVIAYPATLRDVTSIKDVNGLNAEIKSSFVASTLNVTGENSYSPISYKVYILDFAEANNTANKFTVQI